MKLRNSVDILTEESILRVIGENKKKKTIR